MGRVVVAGSINWDRVVRVPTLPRPGETITALGFAEGPGGKGANQAVAAARTTASTEMVGCLGDDAPADELRRFLGEAGVGLAGVHTVSGPTGTAFVSVDDSGENSIVVVPGANGLIDDAAVRGVSIGADDVAAAVCEIPLRAVAGFLAHARRSGARTVLNPAPAQPLPDSVLDAVDVLVVNETERDVVGGVDVRRPGQTMVVTLGASGVDVVDDDGTRHLDARRVETVVDTTGAGDCFVGSLAGRLALGDRLDDALAYAIAAAAICVTRPGAGPSMPTADEVAAFLR